MQQTLIIFTGIKAEFIQSDFVIVAQIQISDSILLVKQLLTVQ